MARYSYEFKGVVERTPKYRKVLKMMKNCMKDGGVVDLRQTGTVTKTTATKTGKFYTMGFKRVHRHLGVYDIKMELE